MVRHPSSNKMWTYAGLKCLVLVCGASGCFLVVNHFPAFLFRELKVTFANGRLVVIEKITLRCKLRLRHKRIEVFDILIEFLHNLGSFYLVNGRRFGDEDGRCDTVEEFGGKKMRHGEEMKVCCV